MPAHKRPDEILLCRVREVFGRRLAIDAREEQTEQERGRVFRHNPEMLLADLFAVSRNRLAREFDERLFAEVKGFQQQVVDQEAKVECRIPEPCDFAVENDEPVASHPEVFRAVIAVDEGESGAGKAMGLGTDQGRKIRVHLRRGEQIGGDAQVVEVPPGVKDPAGLGIVPALAMDSCERSSRGGGGSGLGRSRKKQALPIPKLLAKEFHGKEVNTRKKDLGN